MPNFSPTLRFWEFHSTALILSYLAFISAIFRFIIENIIYFGFTLSYGFLSSTSLHSSAWLVMIFLMPRMSMQSFAQALLSFDFAPPTHPIASSIYFLDIRYAGTALVATLTMPLITSADDMLSCILHYRYMSLSIDFFEWASHTHNYFIIIIALDCKSMEIFDMKWLFSNTRFIS